MSTLDELKPTAKRRVIDLVSAAGIDVSDWCKFAGSEKRAASNPRYCYEWSYLKPGSIVVLNLGHSSLREQKGIVFANMNPRRSVRKYVKARKGVWESRAKKRDDAIQDAAKNRMPVRVIVNDGKKRAAADLNERASRVERRR
jgi:5-methylcytosine-specific restriction enzyme A